MKTYNIHDAFSQRVAFPFFVFRIIVCCTVNAVSDILRLWQFAAGEKMSISIRIDDKLYETAKVRAKAEMRSIPQQIGYWAKIGRAALDNPDLPIEFIRDTLLAMDEDSEPFVLPE